VAPPAQAATCKPVVTFFEIEFGGGFATAFEHVRTRRVGCKTAREVLRACGRSPYPPAGWRGSALRSAKSGRLRFVLRSGVRRVTYHTAQDSTPPCAQTGWPRRPTGVSHGPWVLSARGLQTLPVGMRINDAERSSGLDLRSFGMEVVPFAVELRGGDLVISERLRA
jgi:hypothetical protein